MGRNHARVLKELPNSELVAVADTNLEAAEATAHRLGIHAYTNYIDLLEKERPGAVVIATPPTLHLSPALAVLQAGAHVLVEKPIAATLLDGEKLIAAAQAAGKLLMVGHIVRFNPAVQALKAHLHAGRLGRIFQIACRRVGPFPAPARDIGVVIDLAPHDLDLMCWLLESEPLSLQSQIAQRVHTDFEDLVVSLLRFPGGEIGSLEINWLTPTKVREVCVLGERGLMRVDDLTQDLYFYENARAENWPQSVGTGWPALQTIKGVAEGTMTRFALQRQEPLKAELAAFLSAIQSGGPAPVSGEDGLRALRLALQMLEQVKN